ncbi:MAG TPA: hypothetical protein VF885_06825 [Arthrobacter sp.]
MSARSLARIAMMVVVLAPLAARIAPAQAPWHQPGARLRLTFPCHQPGQLPPGSDRMTCRAEGTLVRWQGDTLAVTSGESTTLFGVSALSRVQVSRGTRSHRLVGAGVGFLAGGGVALAVLYTGGSTSLCDRSANQDAIGSAECLGLTVLGGLAGAGLGAIVGGLFRTERWDDVPLEQLRITLGSLEGRRLGLTLRVVF